MPDILTFGEALVEIMRVEVDQPLDRPALFTGPYPSGAPFIFAVQAARLMCPPPRSAWWAGTLATACSASEADGVDTRGVHILDGHTTGAAFVAYSSDGTRSFVFHIRHAAGGQLTPDLLKPELFEGLKVLHLMGSTLSITTTPWRPACAHWLWPGPAPRSASTRICARS